MSAIDFDWGLAGLNRLKAKVAALVIVDVLSFSTAVDVATGRGAIVYPRPLGDLMAAERAAAAVGAVLARPRGAGGGQVSLSPQSLDRSAPGKKIMLPSPNGSRLSLLAGVGVPLFAGCLRNARAVADAVRPWVGQGGIGVIAAGERDRDNGLRFAIEDLVGAGAILAHLGGEMSAEANMARRAFEGAAPDLNDLIVRSVSGRELAERGFAGDVDYALRRDVSVGAPRLIDGAFQRV